MNEKAMNVTMQKVVCKNKYKQSCTSGDGTYQFYVALQLDWLFFFLGEYHNSFK